VIVGPLLVNDRANLVPRKKRLQWLFFGTESEMHASGFQSNLLETRPQREPSERHSDGGYAEVDKTHCNPPSMLKKTWPWRRKNSEKDSRAMPMAMKIAHRPKMTMRRTTILPLWRFTGLSVGVTEAIQFLG
jgi:hypothetical protein